jgi:hypothetical protein
MITILNSKPLVLYALGVALFSVFIQKRCGVLVLFVINLLISFPSCFWTLQEAVDETDRLQKLVADYAAKHGGMRSADFSSVKSSGSGGFTSANQNGTKAKTKTVKK